jgi:hypothetical protein
MTIGQIIVFALICFSFWLGNRSGYANGYVAGRKAVRKHYDAIAAREAKMNEAYNEKLMQALRDQK